MPSHRATAMRATPTERVAGIAFACFTLLQVPFFGVETPTVPGGLLLLSPLQMAAANAANAFPDAAPALEAALIPGAWMRESLSPFLRCVHACAVSLHGCARMCVRVKNWQPPPGLHHPPACHHIRCHAAVNSKHMGMVHVMCSARVC